MYFLPRANPLYEQIAAEKVVLPGILEKLAKGQFTGYLSHTAQDFEAYCIFAKGKLICAISTENDRAKTGFEAITVLFDKIFSSGGEINVYRMTADLAMCAHALVIGTTNLKEVEVRQVDLKSLMAGIKTQSMNGVVRFSTEERSAMMFYKNGQPIGFYHDKIRNIETTPDEARKVAALPGARVEVRSTKTVEELMMYDLMQMVNLPKLWEAAGARKAAAADKVTSPAPPQTAQPAQPAVQITQQPEAQTAPSQQAPPMDYDEAKLTELVEDLKEVAMAYLSKEGKTLIEKHLGSSDAMVALLDEAKVEALLKQLEDEAMGIDSHARIDEMIDLMRSEIAGRLAV